ncbi:hypothetical protein KSS87_012544 [Heliosperma pusillum]|nr:hypothetical protein KSS87_012544 [Heliosperma pusillum]
MSSTTTTTTQAYLETKPVQESKALITELCRQFYHLGWVGGTGGSITLKVHDDSIPKSQQLIIMSPSGGKIKWLDGDKGKGKGGVRRGGGMEGVQKERMMAEDMYVLSSDGHVVFSPTQKPYPHKPPKCSDCGPLFMKAYQMRDAGAVIHSHGMESCLVTMMNPTSKEFRITHMEMIKGIQGHGYYDELVVPIIENSAHERDLTDALAEAMEAYPKATAVLVRNHGIYVWGDSWISAKTQKNEHSVYGATAANLAAIFLVEVRTLTVHLLTVHCPLRNIDPCSGVKMAIVWLLIVMELSKITHETGCISIYFEVAVIVANLDAVFIMSYPKTARVIVVVIFAVINCEVAAMHFSLACVIFQAECYHYLFDAAIKLNQMGLDWSTPAHGPIKSVAGVSRSENRAVSAKAGKFDSNSTEPLRCIVLDIEGTTTPISFVTNVLFPYARANVGRHLSSTYETPETQDDIKLLRLQVQEDLEAGVAGAIPIPSEDKGKEEVVAALVANVEGMIKADRKITALKQLQGHIWRTGFQNNELEGVVFDDVPEALERWHASGIKVYIYSSGSRLAQRLLFGYTKFGDLRKYLSGFFDTNVGYIEICQSLGVDSPSQILFITDVCQEATAAFAAGLETVISVRPGNGPLPENHGFKMVNSFAEI